MKGRIWIRGQDTEMNAILLAVLDAEGYQTTAEVAAGAAGELPVDPSIDVVLMDFREDAEGLLQTLAQPGDPGARAEVILLADSEALQPALALVRCGLAYTCLRKPLAALDELLIALDHALDKRRTAARARALETQLQQLRADSAAEERFPQLFETMEQGLIYRNDRGVITAVNPAAERILGRPAGELLGRDCHATSCRALDAWGDPLPVDRHPSMLALRSGQTVKGAVLGLFNPLAGETRWLKIHAVPCFKPGQSKPFQVFSCFDDVTALMRVEDALRASEDRHRALMEAIPQGVGEFAPDGTILYANPALCRMHGYAPGGLSGRSILELCSTEHARTRLQDLLAQLVREQPEPVPFRGSNRGADGSAIDVQLDWNYLRTSRGEVTGFIAVVSDVTRIRQAERALQESERRYRELVEEAAEGICVIGPDCTFQAVNPRLCTILGYPRRHLLGLSLTEVLDDPNWARGWRDQGERELGTTCCGETRARRGNGAVFPVAFSARVLEGGSVQAIVRDVSERKAAQQALLESRNRFQETVDLMPSIIAEIDQELNVTYFNQLGLETFACSLDDLKTGLSALDLVHPEERERAARQFERLRTGSKLGPVEVRLRRRDGRVLHGLANGAPILRNGELSGYRISLMDISDFKRLSQRLQDAKSFEAIATLAGGIAHQFNNALAVIKGSTELLQMEIKASEKQRKLLAHIDQSTDRLAGLTAQLLAYARGGRYLPETLKAVDMVRQCLDLVRHVINPAVHLEVDLPASELTVEVDLTQLQMVLSAVLENASEALDGAGAITVRVDPNPQMVKPGDRAARSYVHLIIEDTGKGMTREEKERIFDPFFTTKFQGRGLGMAAAYGIVKNHQGWMEVESEPGQGTRIHVFLPVAEPLSVAAEPEAPARERPDPMKTILVIDDEWTLLDITREILETLGNRVLTAGSGRAALELLEHYQGPIDLALLDLILVDLPAKSVHERLLERYPLIKVVVCSGFSMDGPAQELLDAGAFAFLQKPFSLSDLHRVLQDVFSEEP